MGVKEQPGVVWCGAGGTAAGGGRGGGGGRFPGTHNLRLMDKCQSSRWEKLAVSRELPDRLLSCVRLPRPRLELRAA